VIHLYVVYKHCCFNGIQHVTQCGETRASCACGRNPQEEPHVCVANKSFCAGDFEMPPSTNFIMVPSSDITDQAPHNENVFNFLGVWAKAKDERTGQWNYVRTAMQYGNPAQNWCSNVLVPLVAGASSMVNLTFCTTNEETLSMENIEIVVRNVGGIVESIRWDNAAMQATPFVYPEQSARLVNRITSNSKIQVQLQMQGMGKAKLVTMSCTLNHTACQEGFAVTATSVFEIWVSGPGKQTLINKVLFS